MPNHKRFNLLILIAFIISIVLYHLYGYIGHYGYDDIQYAKLASNVLNGSIDYNDHFIFRFPIILLTSLCYSLFGISDLSSSIPALIISILTILIVYHILKKEGFYTLIIGLSLTTFSNWFLFYSDKLMADIYIAFSVIAVVAVIYTYKYASIKKKPFLYSLLFACSLLFGFMSKGTIVLIIPLLIYIFVIDMIYKRDTKFWTYSIISGIVLFSLYFILIWILTGDVLTRFKSISNNSYINLCSYDHQPNKILLKRITYQFFFMSISQYLITGFIFVIAILFRKQSHNHLKLNNSFSFFVVSSVILLISSNFSTISLTAYSPMCLDPRHYLFLIPVVSIPASKIISQFLKEKKYKIQILIGLLLISLISLIIRDNSTWKLYIPLTIVFYIYSFMKIKSIFQFIFILAISAILLIPPINMVKYAQKVKYRKQKEILSEFVLKSNEKCLVITNPVQKRLGYYYSKFDSGKYINFKSFDEFKFDSTDNTKKLLFLNWYTRYLSNLNNDDLPYYAKNISSLNNIIYENDDLDISIYEMIDFSIPELSEDSILYSINDFEQNYLHWNQNNELISNKTSYSGEQSYQVPEYSSAFNYSLDSLQIKNSISLLIKCSVFCNYNDKTDSRLVISIEDKDGAYIWNGLEINKYIKAYSNWWPVNFEVKIDCNKIKSKSELKIYLWNSDKRTVYIDDFEVSVLKLAFK